MQVYKKKSMCTGCTACVNACPKQAISMLADDSGFLYPSINPEKCIKCGICRKVCHTYDVKNFCLDGTAFCYIHNDSNVLENSSSGGAFSYIAQNILAKGGWICGAVFDSDLNVVHIISKDEEDLSKMRGSKYVQSDLQLVFVEIKSLLQSAETVLFTGTPCQIVGLKKFLGREYENLICVDFVCSSVPSPKVYHLYLDMLEKELGKILAISFRDKHKGWENYSVCIQTEKVKRYEFHKDNLYLCGFMGDLYSRDCCEHCPVKERLGYESDITLGDLWGAKELIPNIDYSKGASLVIVHTSKGRRILNEANLIALEFEEAIFNNPRFRNSHVQNQDANKFWNIMDKKGLYSAYKYIYQPSLLKKIQLKLRKEK